MAIKDYDFEKFADINLSEELIIQLLDETKLAEFKNSPNLIEEVLPVINEIRFIFKMQKSEYIVKIYEVVVEPKKLRLVMQYAEHGSLNQYLKAPGQSIFDDRQIH